jgi:hypothetical protein
MRFYIKYDVTRVFDNLVKNGFVYTVRTIRPRIAT